MEEWLLGSYILLVNECGEHSHGKKDLVPDPGLWGLEFFWVGLFVCSFCKGGRWLVVDCKSASSAPVTGSNVCLFFFPSE